jgi:hypothetical protein
MKVPYDEGIASHIGPESCASDRKGAGEALTGESAGRVLSGGRRYASASGGWKKVETISKFCMLVLRMWPFQARIHA